MLHFLFFPHQILMNKLVQLNTEGRLKTVILDSFEVQDEKSCDSLHPEYSWFPVSTVLRGNQACPPSQAGCSGPALRHLLTVPWHSPKGPIPAAASHDHHVPISRAPELPQDPEAAISCQISLELSVFYLYLSVSYYFDPIDVALKNFAKYFL